MVRKRPCRICRKWFQPNPRVGKRQKVCSESACQRERHRRSCASWRQRNPDYDRENRLRKQLTAEPESTTAPETKPALGTGTVRAAPEAKSTQPGPPKVRIDWDAARDVVQLEVLILIEEFGKVLVKMARDEVRRQLIVFASKFDRHARGGRETR